MVSVSGARIRRRPIADIPMPVMATRSSNFSRDDHRADDDLGQRRLGGLPRVVGRASTGRGCEHREPHVVVLLELHRDAQADVHGVRLHVDDVA